MLGKYLGSIIGKIIEWSIFIGLYHYFNTTEVVSFQTMWIYLLTGAICFAIALAAIGLIILFGNKSLSDELDKHEELKDLKDMFDD